MSGDYYDHPRIALLDLFPAPPRRLLDVGCGAGATGAAARERWPATETIGIERVPAAAERAAARLHRVIEASADELDLAAAGLAGVDGVLLADVLEHLVDPWAFLKRLRAVVAPDATIVASLPNIANLWLIEELAAGRFTYADDGILDATHLRFFTRASIATLFAGAAFRIDRWERTTDGRVDDLTRHRVLGIMLPNPVGDWLSGQRVRVRTTGSEHVDDLRTVQFAIVAKPNE